TKASHDRVEVLAFSHKIMDGSINLEEYSELILKQFYLHKALEQQFENILTAKEKQQLRLGERKKVHLLKYDMLELDIDEKMLCFNKVPQLAINNLEEAIGAMYVLEGSTLGGAVIRRKLEKNLQIQRNSSFNFYGCYGENTGSFWKAFIMQATIIGKTPKSQEKIVNKAVETFKYFEDILAYGEVSFKEEVS
ncbi:MAG: biliverdin-producing heme oxygenase, partial [Bacteroidota bacterium]